ncbi:hypothetical protein KJ756_02165 [Patescibacteria group bacterium]|nr:hypothetical protein [Patescibacteria group bacterium]MBU2579724.1 hypothetical protein [Patescibacteria group bacterium]MBU4030937.1 hypothetical protein [Patescibacteria group bacterium]MBU4082395.1 hypothetical protein [Patescibacteria group bacterium]MCG2809426.1 hypothetical protein [Candidatus Portnoybacteria bacterium]
MIKLNLLSPEEKKEAQLTNFIHWLAFLVVPISAFLIVFILFLLGSFFSLSIMLKAQDEAIVLQRSDSRTQELLKIEERIQKTNKILDQIYLKQNKMVSWTLALIEISEIMPDAARLNNFSYRKSDNTLNLIGWAAERKDILSLEESLKESSLFDQVNSPLSNLIKQENVDFSFTFKPIQ